MKKTLYTIEENTLTKKQHRLFTAGNKAFFDHFYEHYKGYIFSIALRYTKSKNDANDVFQDAFMRIFKYRHSFQQDQSLKSWISRITINVALDFIKKHAKYEQVDYDHNLPDEQNKYEDTFFLDELDDSKADFRQELIKALNQLPDGLRAVFNLYVIDNLTHEEIAQYLGITASTSRSQLTKARKKLKNLLTHIKKNHEFGRVG